MPRWLQLLTGFSIVLLAGSSGLRAEPETLAEWELHDSLGRAWHGELLEYRLDLNRPVKAGEPLSAVDQHGRPVPVQVLEQTTNNAGDVTQVRLALLTDLEPFGQRRFRLLAAVPRHGPADLHVAQEADRWILGSSQIGIAVPAGASERQEGILIRDAPAPILSLRGAATGWVGQGWFTGNRLVVAWKSEVLAEGPVLAWARVKYEFGNGEYYVVEVRVPAGQPVVLVREVRNLPDVLDYVTDPSQGDVFHLALAPGLRPTHVYSKRQLGSRGYFVEAGPEFRGTHLTPAQMHWVESCCNTVGTWREGSHPAGFIGLFPRFLSHWDRPHHTFVPLAWDTELGLTARFFLNHGAREWGLMAGPKERMIVPQGEGGEGQLAGHFDALRLNNKWGETPLDKVKDWTLDWGSHRYQPDANYEPAPRARGTMLYFAEQFLQGGQKWEDTYIHVHQTWTGEGDAWGRHRELVATLPPEQLLSARAAAAFVMYKQTDPDYWPAGNWIGPANPNMIYMGNAATLLGALVLQDHPRAKGWAEVGVQAVRENLVKSTSPDGAWIECPGYDGAGVAPILRAAVELHQTGLGDLLSDGRLLKVGLYHAHLVTPPDPRVNGVRHLPEFGDCFDLRTDKFAERARPTYWKSLVPILKDTHPRELGQILWSLGETEGWVPIVPIEGRSRQIAGFGAVFRHAFGTPHESYLAIHQDSFGYGHYHFDLGSLYFFAKGAPLCVDWPSMYTPQISEPWMHNTVAIGRMPRYAYRGHVCEGVLSPRVDYTRSRVFHDREVPLPEELAAGDIPPRAWQRQVFFVKGSEPEAAAYVVVRDAVHDKRPSEWNLWTLADKLRLEEGRADVTGTYGVDLAVRFFVSPGGLPSTETFGFGEPLERTPGEEEAQSSGPAAGVGEVVVPRRHLMQQSVIRLGTPANGQYGAVLYPRRPHEPLPAISAGPDETVTISAEGRSDLVLAYPNERAVQVDDVMFDGRAAIVSRSGNQVELHLLEGRSLRLADGIGVRGQGPVHVIARSDRLLDVHADSAARAIEIALPNDRQGRAGSAAGIEVLESVPGRLRVRISGGPRRFEVSY